MNTKILSILDIQHEIDDIIKRAIQFKSDFAANQLKPYLQGKLLALLFERPSTRTRISFEMGMHHLGGNSIFLTQNEIKLGTRESAEDIALVLSRYVDIIMYRPIQKSHLHELAHHATVPVINGLDQDEHPCQILSDLMTIKEHKKTFKDLHFIFIGDGDDNLTHSYLLGCPLVGMNITVISPKKYWPQTQYLKKAQQLAAKKDVHVNITEDLSAIATGDIITTDTWISYWYEDQRSQRLRDLSPYTITKELMMQANKEAIFMHCMPLYYGEEVVKEVAHGPQSIIIDEAENRMWTQMALMTYLLEK